MTCGGERFRYWQGNGLAIHRSRVRVLIGRYCVVARHATYTYVTKQYNNLVPAKMGHLFGSESNRGPGGK